MLKIPVFMQTLTALGFINLTDDEARKEVGIFIRKTVVYSDLSGGEVSFKKWPGRFGPAVSDLH